MEGFRFLGFIAVTLIVVIGLDYFQQNKKTEARLSLSGYVDSINHRFDQRQDEQQAKEADRARQRRWDAGPQPYFPEPLPGWTQYALTDRDQEVVATALSLFFPPAKIAFDDVPPELVRMMEIGSEGKMRKLERTSALYANGSDLILMTVSFKKKSSRNTVAGLAISGQTAVMDSMKRKEGYAVVDGVAFIEELSQPTSGDDARDYRTFTGRIGFDEEVIIRLHTTAEDSAIRDVLDAIDYAQLNTLLSLPASVVGKGIEVPLDRQPEIADQMMAVYSKLMNKQNDLAHEKIKNIDTSAILINALAGSGYDTDGVVDITGGEVFENQDLMQMTYNRTQDILLTSALQAADPAPEPEAESEPKREASNAGFFDRLFKKQRKTPAPVSSSVTVSKGGAGGSSCAVIGNAKRCSISGN